MAEDGPDFAVERLPAAAAFELLAHETRFRTIEALSEADGPVSFGDLRDRVGVDDPGQFNYHLGKLTDRFVRKRDGGYVLTAAGRRVVGAVLSGGYTQALDAKPIEMDATCEHCEGALETRFSTDEVVVTCSSCGFDWTTPEIPPGALEGWSRQAVPGVIDRWLKRKEHSAFYGLCPMCDGRLDQSLVRPDDEAAPAWFEGDLAPVLHLSTCRQCGHWWHAAVELAALAHPAVAGYHHEHGIDLRETPVWELDWLTFDAATVHAEEPLRIDVRITLAGSTRVFTFDDSLSVVDTTDE